MADALISELNRVGFQPIFLPQTGLTLQSYTTSREKSAGHGWYAGAR